MKSWTFALTAALSVATLASPPAMSAEAFPNKPVRIIVPFGSSSGLDPVARTMAESMSHQTGGSFIVENREGGGGMVGVLAGAAAPADGYTILMVVHPPFAAAPFLQRKQPYDPIRDFTPIARVSVTPLILIAANTSPFKTFTEMANFAKQNPGKLNYASSGIGTASHLYMEQIKLAMGLEIAFVPYRSTGQQMADTISGQVHMSLPSLIGGLPQVQAGKARLLAIGGASRQASFPDVPTFAEASGIAGFDAAVWYGFVGPRGMPDAIAARINAEMATALNSPRVTKVIEDGGAQKAHTSPGEFAALIQAGALDTQKIIKSLNIELQ